MVVKKTAKRSQRHKKVMQIAAETQSKDLYNAEERELRNEEDAIRRQFRTIKRDYGRLVDDVTTGYGLIKNWVGLQASTRGEYLVSRLTKS